LIAQLRFRQNVLKQYVKDKKIFNASVKGNPLPQSVLYFLHGYSYCIVILMTCVMTCFQKDNILHMIFQEFLEHSKIFVVQLTAPSSLFKCQGIFDARGTCIHHTKITTLQKLNRRSSEWIYCLCF
jgi:hypothetical protein